MVERMMTFLAMSAGYKEIDYRYSGKNRERDRLCSLRTRCWTLQMCVTVGLCLLELILKINCRVVVVGRGLFRLVVVCHPPS